MSKKILVCDDSKVMRSLLIRIMREKFSNAIGHCVEASHGKQGFQCFMSEALDLILLDWKMPEIDGLTLIKMIRASPSANNRVPIVMITAEKSTGHIREAVKAGANQFIAKPFTPDSIFKSLEPFICK